MPPNCSCGPSGRVFQYRVFSSTSSSVAVAAKGVSSSSVRGVSSTWPFTGTVEVGKKVVDFMALEGGGVVSNCSGPPDASVIKEDEASPHPLDTAASWWPRKDMGTSPSLSCRACSPPPSSLLLSRSSSRHPFSMSSSNVMEGRCLRRASQSTLGGAVLVEGSS